MENKIKLTFTVSIWRLKSGITVTYIWPIFFLTYWIISTYIGLYTAFLYINFTVDALPSISTVAGTITLVTWPGVVEVTCTLTSTVLAKRRQRTFFKYGIMCTCINITIRGLKSLSMYMYLWLTIHLIDNNQYLIE